MVDFMDICRKALDFSGWTKITNIVRVNEGFVFAFTDDEGHDIFESPVLYNEKSKSFGVYFPPDYDGSDILYEIKVPQEFQYIRSDKQLFLECCNRAAEFSSRPYIDRITKVDGGYLFTFIDENGDTYFENPLFVSDTDETVSYYNLAEHIHDERIYDIVVPKEFRYKC